MWEGGWVGAWEVNGLIICLLAWTGLNQTLRAIRSPAMFMRHHICVASESACLINIFLINPAWVQVWTEHFARLEVLRVPCVIVCSQPQAIPNVNDNQPECVWCANRALRVIRSPESSMCYPILQSATSDCMRYCMSNPIFMHFVSAFQTRTFGSNSAHPMNFKEDMRLRRRLPPPVAAPTCVRHDAMQCRMSECPIRSKDLLEIPKRSHKLSEQFQNVFRRCLMWQVVQTWISSTQSQKQPIPKNASEGGVTVKSHVSRLSHG